MATNKKSTPLLPAYLMVGEDALKRRTVMDRLRKRVAQEGALEFNHETFSGETATAQQIIDACNTLPFASNLRLVEVTEADKLRSADADALASYVEAPNSTTVLELFAEKMAKNRRLYKGIAKLGKSAIIDCTPLKKEALQNAVRSMATGRGFTITADAAERLIQLVGEDTVHLDSELQKIALAHRGNDAVNTAEVESLVAQTAEVKPWDFVNAFAERNLKKCLHLRPLLKSVSPYALLAMCTTRVRELICAKSLANRGHGSPENISQALNVKPAWRVKQYPLWARRYTEAELRQALVLSRDAERAMKSGADPEVAFMDWVIAVARPQER